MSAPDPRTVVELFNERINSRDLEGLSALMTDDHVFIDSADTRQEGRAIVLDAWRRFFESFPDYRNQFERIEVSESTVVVTGRSICSFAALDGPALWTARVRDGNVSEWRVYDDTPDNRRLLGLEPAP